MVAILGEEEEKKAVNTYPPTHTFTTQPETQFIPGRELVAVANKRQQFDKYVS